MRLQTDPSTPKIASRETVRLHVLVTEEKSDLQHIIKKEIFDILGAFLLKTQQLTKYASHLSAKSRTKPNMGVRALRLSHLSRSMIMNLHELEPFLDTAQVDIDHVLCVPHSRTDQSLQTPIGQ